MVFRRSTRLLLCSIFASFLLCGCGGGGGESESTASNGDLQQQLERARELVTQQMDLVVNSVSQSTAVVVLRAVGSTIESIPCAEGGELRFSDSHAFDVIQHSFDLTVDATLVGCQGHSGVLYYGASGTTEGDEYVVNATVAASLDGDCSLDIAQINLSAIVAANGETVAATISGDGSLQCGEMLLSCSWSGVDVFDVDSAREGCVAIG